MSGKPETSPRSAPNSTLSSLAALGPGERDAVLGRFDARALRLLLGDWTLQARPDQLPPPGDWTTWAFIGGRGAGKTRAGAEWVKGLVLGRPPFADVPVGRIAVIGETHADVRDVMIEGPSGLLAVWRDRPGPTYAATRRRIVYPNGAEVLAFSAEEPDSLRGPQFEAVWCDEVAKWRYVEETFDMLQFGLRLGARPRQLVNTTPRPIPWLKRLLAAPDTALTRAASQANAAHLAPGFMARMAARYAGSRLGRQELDGDIIEERADALFDRAAIDAARVRTAPDLIGTVIAVDPAVTGHRGSDASGIIVAGRGADGAAYVLEDATVSGVKPEVWSARVVALARRHGADRVVVEVNQGGDLVRAVLASIDPGLVVVPVRAQVGKWLRAEPVAALYARGLVRHVGGLPALEDEMCDFGLDGLSNGRSPDRLDALVWAIAALGVGGLDAPRVRTL